MFCSRHPVHSLSWLILILGPGCGNLLGIGDLSTSEFAATAGKGGHGAGSGGQTHNATSDGGFSSGSSTRLDTNTVVAGSGSVIPIGGNTSTHPNTGGASSTTQHEGGGASPNSNAGSAGTGGTTGDIQSGGTAGIGSGGNSAFNRAGAGGITASGSSGSLPSTEVTPVTSGGSVIAGSAPPDGPTNKVARCGGPWSFQHVEAYDGTLGAPQWFVARHQLAVGSAAYGCSGTLISDDLFLSAGHCGYNVGDLVWFNRQNGKDGTPLPATAFRVIQVVEQEDNEATDYAIVRLEGSPGREFGHASLSDRDPEPLAHVVIIQGAPKVVHAGVVTAAESRMGDHWFSYDANTVEGAAGAGILNENGDLIGVHTDDGCRTDAAGQVNSGMRMSWLRSRSTTLSAMLVSRVLWVYQDGRVSLWFADANDGSRLMATDINALPGRIPLSFSGNKVLWRDPSGEVSLWMIDSDPDTFPRIANYGRDPDLTPINCANDRVLWKHVDGHITLRRINEVGEELGLSKDHQPPDGWQPINYSNNRILWSTAEGNYALWILDDEDEFQGKVVYDGPTGFQPMNYANNEILWTDDANRISLWVIARDGTPLKKGPPIIQSSGMLPVSYADRRVLWRNTEAHLNYASTWALNSAGERVWVSKNYDYPNWTPYFTTGGLP